MKMVDYSEDKILDFYGIFSDLIEDYINDDLSESELISEIYDSELNHNNSDKGSQKAYSRDEIKLLLDSTIEYMRQEDDRCSECARLLKDEDYIGDYEARPYGDTVAYEAITTGYICECGHREDY